MKGAFQKYEGWVRMTVVIFTMSSYYFSLKYEAEAAHKECVKIGIKITEIDRTVNEHHTELALLKQQLKLK